MSDYKRFVSYVYTYDYGKKNNNVGFVKVDSRNNICKVIINFRLAHLPVLHPLKVYFFKREEGRLVGILLGTGKISGPTFDFRNTTNSENINESGYRIDDISGIFVSDGFNKNIVYASEWDNKSIHPEQFILYNDKIREQNVSKVEKPERTEKSEKLERPVQLERYERPERLERPERPQQPERSERSERANTNTPTMQVDDKVVELIQNYVNTTQESEDEKSSILEDKKANDYEYENITIEMKSTPKESIWDQLYNKYTKVIGIKDNDQYECIKIKPQDLACLPNQYWILGNNSFLLHGYYNYRYLLFAKVINEDSSVQKYKLGIPGIFHKNEKIMASMFGFNEFLEAEQINKGKDAFGYWCMDIQIP